MLAGGGSGGPVSAPHIAVNDPDSFSLLRLLAHVHGHIGWLAAAALVHPAIVLRKPRRRAHWAVGSSVALVTLAVALGMNVYGEYGARLKQTIFLRAPVYGWMFERKEHLAFGAAALTYAGALLYVAARRSLADAPEDAQRFQRVAALAFALAAPMAVVAATIATMVAAYRTF
jgi:hypothetical protein